jgi:hypothetical protein
METQYGFSARGSSQIKDYGERGLTNAKAEYYQAKAAFYTRLMHAATIAAIGYAIGYVGISLVGVFYG